MKSKGNIYLEELVKYACNDLGEDFNKVKSRFMSWGLRGLKEISRQTLNLGVSREIIPINQNTNTANIPCDAKSVNYVGIINDCGEKESLTLNTKLVGNVEQKPCIEKCESCGEDKDICEQLEVVESEIDVDINGTNYKEKTVKRIIGNEYYEITNTPYFDYALNDVVFKESRKFISLLDLNNCGCVKRTDENIQVIKENCYSCYVCCYAPCVHNTEDIGSYTVSMKDGLIHFNKSFDYDNVYIEYTAGIPKDKGKIVVPEIASEVIAYYISFKYKENNKRFSQGDQIRAFEMYKIQKRNMIQNLGKINLDDLIRILHKTPRFALNMPVDNCNTSKGGQGKLVGDTIVNNIFNIAENQIKTITEDW